MAYNKRYLATQRADAAAGKCEAFYELGIAYSVGGYGLSVDLVEAHKWFNLAAMKGDARAQRDRAEVAVDMTPAEIAAAQREARAFLSSACH